MFSTSIRRIRVQNLRLHVVYVDQQVKVPFCNLEQSSVLLSVMLLKRHRFSTQKQSLQFLHSKSYKEHHFPWNPARQKKVWSEYIFRYVQTDCWGEKKIGSIEFHWIVLIKGIEEQIKRWWTLLDWWWNKMVGDMRCNAKQDHTYRSWDSAEGEKLLYKLIFLGFCCWNEFIWNRRYQVKIVPTVSAASLKVRAAMYT